VYEDLGIHKDSVLDPSFSINNIVCAPMDQSYSNFRPATNVQHLLGATNNTGQLYTLPPKYQTYYNTPELTVPSTSSSTSLETQTEVRTNSQRMVDMDAPISELARTSSCRPCITELSDIEFCGHKRGCSAREMRYLNVNASPVDDITLQRIPAGNTGYNYATLDPQSFPSSYTQTCQVDGETHVSSVQQNLYTTASELATVDQLQVPSWEELPLEFQDLTMSANLPFTPSTNIDMSTMYSTPGSQGPWDIEYSNFMMDMNFDIDMPGLD
jgi:hypothetical protein